MVSLATAYPGRAVSVKEIGQTQHLSVKYLEQIMAALKGAGLIKVVRGGQGGYLLSREPSHIKVVEVYRALEGPVLLVDCIEDSSPCPMIKICPTREMWAEMTEALEAILDRTTIQDLVERKKEKSRSLDPMYYI